MINDQNLKKKQLLIKGNYKERIGNHRLEKNIWQIHI